MGFSKRDFEKEEKIILLDALNMLPPKHKEVIELSFFQDMSQSEIAEETGVSQMQISRRLKKALEELAEILTKKWNQNA